MTARTANQALGQQLTTGELLLAFAYASDLAFGLQLEDSVRSCYLATRLARHMGLPEAECISVYYTALLKDAGCTAWTTEEAGAWHTDEIVARRELMIFGDPHETRDLVGWMRRYVAQDESRLRKLARYANVLTTTKGFFGEGFSVTCKVATRIAARLGLPREVQEATLNLFEYWNGKGLPRGIAGTDVPIVSRVVQPTFWVVPFHRVSGRAAAVQVALRFRDTAFDPAVVDAFRELARDENFWAEFEADDIRDRVLAIEPESEWRLVDDARTDDVALAFADYIDLKSRYKAAHSRRVGAIADRSPS